LLGIDQVLFQVFQVVVSEIEAPLQDTIRQALLSLQEIDDL
jgi:hypothetical protein